jgi:hypothetical protein
MIELHTKGISVLLLTILGSLAITVVALGQVSGPVDLS